MEVLYIFLLIIGILSFSSIITLCTQYESYRKVYKSLKYRTFYKNGSQIYSYKLRNRDDGFVWFTDDNSFKLEKFNYLQNQFYTYLDPYSLYWLLKYRKWFKENVDINKLEKF